MDKGFLTNETDAKEYTQDFTSQSSVSVTHNLGYKPDVWFEDNSGTEFSATVQHTSVNAFTATFGTTKTGTVHYQ